MTRVSVKLININQHVEKVRRTLSIKSGLLVVLKLVGGPITIKCSKHDFVLNSTPYFEYVAMSVAVQTNDWFRNIIAEIGGSLMKMMI